MGRWSQQLMNGSRADEMGIKKGEESRATRTGPDRTSTAHADDIIHQRAGVTFSWRRNVAITVQLCPLASFQVEGPGVVIVIGTVGSAKTRRMLGTSMLEGTRVTDMRILSSNVTHACPVR